MSIDEYLDYLEFLIYNFFYIIICNIKNLIKFILQIII
jgi:hypothetical protein